MLWTWPKATVVGRVGANSNSLLGPKVKLVALDAQRAVIGVVSFLPDEGLGVFVSFLADLPMDQEDAPDLDTVLLKLQQRVLYAHDPQQRAMIRAETPTVLSHLRAFIDTHADQVTAFERRMQTPVASDRSAER